MAILCPNCYKQYDVTLFQFGQSLECECGTVFNPFETTPMEIPIDGVLDLHTFKPNEIKDLVREYVKTCMERGIFRIRIVHGKGTGTLFRTVHSILKKMPEVDSFEMAGQDEGGWGVTIVRVKEPENK